MGGNFQNLLFLTTKSALEKILREEFDTEKPPTS